MPRRKTTEDNAVNIIVYILTALVFLVTLYPFYLAFVLSFNEGMDANQGGIYFWPREPTLENYKEFFNDIRWVKATLVTMARTIVGTVLTVLSTSMVAYALSFRKLVNRKLYIKLIIFSMYFHGGVIPYYLVLRWTHLLDSFFVYIIPLLLSLFFVLVSISFFQGIPAELHESALLDGANDIQIMFRIIMPISLPLLATISIFTAVSQWNQWFDSTFFVKSENLRTLAYMMLTVNNRTYTMQKNITDPNVVITITPLSVQITAMIISVAPIMVVYPFLQKYFISGLTLGSVKG